MKLVTAGTAYSAQEKAILIHTSVKLVTQPRHAIRAAEGILIHTSVKLVTRQLVFFNLRLFNILIHTSVKLVTRREALRQLPFQYFNPHEREARDTSAQAACRPPAHFNPHEREARDAAGSLSSAS